MSDRLTFQPDPELDPLIDRIGADISPNERQKNNQTEYAKWQDAGEKLSLLLALKNELQNQIKALENSITINPETEQINDDREILETKIILVKNHIQEILNQITVATGLTEENIFTSLEKYIDKNVSSTDIAFLLKTIDQSINKFNY
jgi:hypothetical protein